MSLGAGQSRRVTVSLPERSFAYWSTRFSTWVVARGRYGIYVGDSSASLPLHAFVRRVRSRLAAGVY
jgi:beta-glucosidase